MTAITTTIEQRYALMLYAYVHRELDSFGHMTPAVLAFPFGQDLTTMKYMIDMTQDVKRAEADLNNLRSEAGFTALDSHFQLAEARLAGAQSRFAVAASANPHLGRAIQEREVAKKQAALERQYEEAADNLRQSVYEQKQTRDNLARYEKKIEEGHRKKRRCKEQCDAFRVSIGLPKIVDEEKEDE